MQWLKNGTFAWNILHEQQLWKWYNVKDRTLYEYIQGSRWKRSLIFLTVKVSIILNCKVLHHFSHHQLGLLSLVVEHFKFSRDTLDIGTRLFSSVSLSRAGGSKTSHIYQKKCFPVIFITNKLPAFSSNSEHV